MPPPGSLDGDSRSAFSSGFLLISTKNQSVLAAARRTDCGWFGIFRGNIGDPRFFSVFQISWWSREIDTGSESEREREGDRDLSMLSRGVKVGGGACPALARSSLRLPLRPVRGSLALRVRAETDDPVVKEQGVPSSTQQESQEGPSWFEETRQAAEQTTKPKSKYVDRQDLYTDNWDGDTYTGGGLNILTVLVGLGLGVPLVGLVFAYLTWGELWGT